MAIAGQYAVEDPPQSIPTTMLAAVYRGLNDVRLETVPVPKIGPGEMLVRVHSCGVCGTDLKKISTGSHSAPRIFGHETSGVIAAVGEGVSKYRPGDRVMVFHHIPCRECFYCRAQDFRSVRHIQEGRLYGWIRAFRRRFCRICPRDGLDRPARYRSDSRRSFFRAGLLRRARQHLYEGNRGVASACRRDRAWPSDKGRSASY